MSTTLQEILQNLLGLLRNEGSKHGSKARNSEQQAWRVNVVFWILNPAVAPNGKPATSVVVRAVPTLAWLTPREGEPGVLLELSFCFFHCFSSFVFFSIRASLVVTWHEVGFLFVSRGPME
jgi:hypothetical protein